MAFERVSAETVWKGRIAEARVEHWRMEDGEEVEREVVGHPGAVGIVAHDGEQIYMVSQPREPVGERRLLELPAGKLDHDGEDVLTTAKRELAEEIGKAARTWQHLTTFYSSPGFSDEEIHVYLATDLYDESAETNEEERIEIVTVPLSELDDVIRDCRDSKTLVGLLWLKAFGESA
jgi:8-oxo-dGTP pyrophosphatase MutT (NUDIX family)